MHRYYVYPVTGRPTHGVIIEPEGHSFSLSFDGSFAPADDEARCQGYYLCYEPQTLWREATKPEQSELLKLFEDQYPEYCDELKGVSGV